VKWLRAHDRGFSALRRAGRAALVMPAMFALGDVVIGNPAVATFAAFGSFSMLLLVDFAGPMRSRVQAQAALAVACSALVCIGTLASRTTWLAVAAMAVVAFGVLFAGVVSSVLASATTALLLAFILPVSLSAPAEAIPDRLAGWAMASGAALLAIVLLWPAPARDPLRTAASAACRALAARLRAEIAHVQDGAPADEHDAAIARSDAAVSAVHEVFFATPYRPTGLSTSARAVVRLVDELKWLNTIVVQAARWPEGMAPDPRACKVKSAAAPVLDAAAGLLDAPLASPDPLRAALADLRAALDELERGAVAPDDRAVDVISALDPSFRAQELSFVVAQIAGNVDLAAAAERRSWPAQLLGRRPAGLTGRFAAAQERAGSHVERHSLWLQNSVRGAVGLALAVLVAELSGVQHAFWVVLGTLSVLRSNALSTGENVIRGLLGTLSGFVAGAALVAAIGTNTTVLWILLPPAVLLAGLAPAVISFAAGQAAFTLTLLILFNILAPEGWEVGLVRIEDVALGSAVSLAVGVLFWPRGAAGALGTALADAYVDSASYLAAAVEYGTARDGEAPPAAAATRAAAAARRLDDTFRTFLAERGAKRVPLADVATLVTGVVALRLAGDAVLDLWQRGDAPAGGYDGARAELLDESRLMTGWYADFATSLAGRGDVPEPLPHDAGADGRLAAAVSRDGGGATAVRMIWTGDHLDAVRRLESTLAPSAALIPRAVRRAPSP
jgi:uncharacterized membrane protein YccC